jgi:RNA polymerase sigma-70 factor (ECF subfamily)
MLMDDHEEAQLVRCAQADPAQFVALYERYVERIYAYVQRQTQDEPTTQDIVATTFAQALQHLPKYRWRGVSFGAWLYKIARNEIRRHYHHGRLLAPLTEWLPSNHNVEQVVQKQNQVHFLRQAMSRLSARDQEVLQLHYDEELSHSEMGTVLGCSSRNVAVRLHRAIQRLRQQVETMEATKDAS